MSIQSNKEEALRWLEQAEHNLAVAKHNLDGGFYSDAIPTRYPDALASPAVPYKTYIKKDAIEAISLAEKMTEMVRKRL